MQIHTLLDIPSHYAYSEELSLGLQMFWQSFPEQWQQNLSYVEDWQISIEQLLKNTLVDYVLLIREPALLLPDNITNLFDTLIDNPDCQAITASQWFNYSGDITFLSLRGFEVFTQKLAKHTPLLVPFEEEQINFILAKKTLLQKIDIKRCPFQEIKDNFIISRATHICFHSFAQYYQKSREELIPLLPEKFNNVLDIGCASGHFGALLKTHYNCNVTGIEQNKQQAKQAQKRLDKVINADILTTQFDQQFDLVSCLDVIEHLQFPEKLLQQLSHSLLLDQGYLLLSIPNVGHWSMLEDLLAGRWDYIPAGLLCNTHLRFFTYQSIKTLLQQFQLTIVQVKSIRLPAPAIWSDTLQSLQQANYSIAYDSLDTLEYHILAQKQ